MGELNHTLRDRYHRTIDYLRISVTDRCNLRCLYCMPERGPDARGRDDLLGFDQIERIVRTALDLGIKKIKITGGEPLLRKGLVQLVERLAALKRVADLSLTTNGVLLRHYARDLARAGLHRVNISLDTLDPSKYRFLTGCDALPQVLEGLDRAVDVGLTPVKINAVVVRGINDDEIEDLVRLTLDRPLHVRFIELMPLGNKEFWRPERFLPGDEVKRRCKSLGRLLPLEGTSNSPARPYRLAGAKGVIGFINPVSSPFCEDCNRLRLSCNGRLRPCLYSDVEVDLRKALFNGNRSQAGLADLIYLAAGLKPLGHQMEVKTEKSSRCAMWQLGG